MGRADREARPDRRSRGSSPRPPPRSGASAAPPPRSGDLETAPAFSGAAGAPLATRAARVAGWACAAAATLLDPPVGLLLSAPHACFLPRRGMRSMSRARRKRGLLVVLGGVEGPSVIPCALAAGLTRAGWKGGVFARHWNRGAPLARVVGNLMSRGRHERESARLAALLQRQHAQHPGAPLALVAVSAGCWIALRAVEKLDGAVRVASLALLAPAISPAYDLSRAAERCGRIYSVRSPVDWFYLGLGTTLFGSADRVHGPSAGLRGWRHRPDNLREMCWRPAWARLGYLGNHTTVCAPGFIRRIVGPWVLASAEG